MGAVFRDMVLPGEMAWADVKAEFEEAQDRDRYENGHSYSGGFGMARGLKYRAVGNFASVDDARSWLEDNAQKWEEALAVRTTDTRERLWNGNNNPAFGKEVWVIGALCAE